MFTLDMLAWAHDQLVAKMRAESAQRDADWIAREIGDCERRETPATFHPDSFDIGPVPDAPWPVEACGPTDADNAQWRSEYARGMHGVTGPALLPFYPARPAYVESLGREADPIADAGQAFIDDLAAKGEPELALAFGLMGYGARGLDGTARPE